MFPALSEEIIVKYKDTVLTTEKSKGASWHKAFYVFKPEKYRGKKVMFRMNLKRTAGSAPLAITFRCSTNPGNVLRAGKTLPNPCRKNGEKVPAEFVLNIPDLDNLYHFNMHFEIKRLGREKCVWELSDLRYVEYEEGALRRSFCIWWQYAFI